MICNHQNQSILELMPIVFKISMDNLDEKTRILRGVLGFFKTIGLFSKNGMKLFLSNIWSSPELIFGGNYGF